MCYRSFITWFCDKYTAVVGIQGISEDVENKVSFADKADREALAILRFGRTTVGTPALKIKYPIKIRAI
ncbi:MAG: hypothetical protein Mars2KO_31780 [Maribacter sp.]